MSRITKEGVVALLEEQRFDELAEIVVNKRGTLRYLNRLLYDTDKLVRWRAIEGMGVIADRLAEDDPESVRVIIRTLLWSINDESGGIGWSAPECIGEIIFRRPEMFEEFASVIISHADEAMLRRGVVWAAGRIAQARPDLVREELPELVIFLDDPDPVLRGYTLRLLAILEERPDFNRYQWLLEDPSLVPLYEGGVLIETTVAELAAALVNDNK